MLTLEKLLGELEYQCVQGNTDRQITQVVFDSRNIIKDCVFICIEGAKFDGHSVAAAAAAGGQAPRAPPVNPLCFPHALGLPSSSSRSLYIHTLDKACRQTAKAGRPALLTNAV